MSKRLLRTIYALLTGSCVNSKSISSFDADEAISSMQPDARKASTAVRKSGAPSRTPFKQLMTWDITLENLGQILEYRDSLREEISELEQLFHSCLDTYSDFYRCSIATDKDDRPIVSKPSIAKRLSKVGRCLPTTLANEADEFALKTLILLAVERSEALEKAVKAEKEVVDWLEFVSSSKARSHKPSDYVNLNHEHIRAATLAYERTKEISTMATSENSRANLMP